MNTVEQDVVAAINAVAPESIAAQVVAAAGSTIADASPMNVMSDIELLLSLSKQIKALAATHPTLGQIVKAIF